MIHEQLIAIQKEIMRNKPSGGFWNSLGSKKGRLLREESICDKEIKELELQFQEER